MRRTASVLGGAIACLALVLSACDGDGAGPTGPSGRSGPTSPTGPTATSGPTGSASPSPAGVVVGGQAALAPEPGRRDQLGCSLVFQDLPEGGPIEVRLETLGLGVGSQIQVRVGRQWDDAEVTDGPRDNQILVFETVEGEPAGDHGCRVLEITGPGGAPIPFGGEVVTLDGPTIAPQEVLDFIADFPRAIREDDRDFLLSTLNPAVLARYGDTRCLAMLGDGFADPSFALSLLRVRNPRDYTYVSDGLETVVPDTWELDVLAVSDEGSGESWVHYARTQDGLTWFTDCGSPLPGA